MACTCVKCDECSAKQPDVFDEIKKPISQMLDVYESEVSDELKYDFIFKIWNDAGRFKINDYYSPDTSYKEDYTAFISAVCDTYESIFTGEEKSRWPGAF